VLSSVKDKVLKENPKVAFNQIILAAPDIDKDEFEQIAGRIVGVATGITLYASSTDSRWHEMGHGTARYEAAHPGGEHHHHVVCDRCGRVAQFSDDGLEQAIATLSERLEFAIDQHDVVLRGTCPNCR
jgi:hypothetical protein